MLGPLRTLISVSAVVGFVWFSFYVDLGGKTLAGHVDRISETAEAQELIEGTRSRVNPALDEVKTRVLGEMVVAPTAIDGEAPEPMLAAGSSAAPHRLDEAGKRDVEAEAAGASEAEPAADRAAEAATGERLPQVEPALPGR